MHGAAGLATTRQPSHRSTRISCFEESEGLIGLASGFPPALRMVGSDQDQTQHGNPILSRTEGNIATVRCRELEAGVYPAVLESPDRLSVLGLSYVLTENRSHCSTPYSKADSVDARQFPR